MTTRYHPLKKGYEITSPYGWRSFDNSVHSGIDFGNPKGSSAGWPVFAIQSGTVTHAGAAQGYGGPAPAGWLVIDSDDDQGAGVFEYGHIVALDTIKKGTQVRAGQQIAIINPDSKTNGGVDPHLHVSRMPFEFNSGKKYDWKLLLNGATYPDESLPEGENGMSETDGKAVRVQLRGPGDGGWVELAPQPDDEGNTYSYFLKRNTTAQTVVEALGTVVFELTLRLPRVDRGYADFKKRKGDTIVGNAANAASIAAENQDLLKKIVTKLGA
jgi:Peptidase family M23